MHYRVSSLAVMVGKSMEGAIVMVGESSLACGVGNPFNITQESFCNLSLQQTSS